MKKLFSTLICVACITLIIPLASAQFSDPNSGIGTGNSEEKSTSSIISSSNAIAPGEKFEVALKLSHPPKWHSYYHNDGIGISQIPAVKWILPDGFTASSLKFPTPQSFDSFGLKS